MKEVSKKLLEARKLIATTPIKKEGNNSYSKYDYFTPSQVSELVTKACQATGLLTMYSLENTEFGYEGHLAVLDTESGETLSFTMATAMPEITATNAAQKLGGMATFNERYLKMSVFEIVDNNLDFDAQDNRPSQSSSPAQPTQQVGTKKATKDILNSLFHQMKQSGKKERQYADGLLASKGFMPLEDKEWDVIQKNL